MMAVFASFAAWLFPSFGVLRKGFDNPSRFDLTSGVILACWYLLIFVSFTCGQKAGQFMSFPKNEVRSELPDLDSTIVYLGLTLLSLLGVVMMLVQIFHTLSLPEAILYISRGEANALKDTIYEDYHIGIVSLRYLVIYPASLALYRIIRFKSFSLLNLLNVLMLVIITFLSSRLLFVATLVTTSFILSFGKRSIRVSIPKLSIAATLLFLILSALNISRNADFYERNHLSFGLAGVSEILAYLGSPFQASVASAKVTDKLDAGYPYRDYVDIEEVLNTTSAFVLLHQQMGYPCWIYITLICTFMGFTFEALASLGKTAFLLPCGAILYASAELWRLDLFQQGTFIVWFVIGVGLPAFVLFGTRLRNFLARLYRMPISASGPSGSGQLKMRLDGEQ